MSNSPDRTRRPPGPGDLGELHLVDAPDDGLDYLRLAIRDTFGPDADDLDEGDGGDAGIEHEHVELAVPESSVDLPGTVTPVGLELPAQLTYDQWKATGEKLAGMHRSLLFWLGDWFNRGVDQFGEDAYQEAPLGYASETLRKAQWVCERVPLVRRRTSLSFTHHHEVATLAPAEQESLLDKAEAEGWSSRELRNAVRRLEATEKRKPRWTQNDFHVRYQKIKDLVNELLAHSMVDDRRDLLVEFFERAVVRLNEGALHPEEG